MIVNFSDLIEDSKKKDLNYKLYLPENFQGYADSQTKAIIDILSIPIKEINGQFLIPLKAFDSNMKKSDFSSLERQILRNSSYSDPNGRVEAAENLEYFTNKKNQIIDYLIISYSNYYRIKKNL